MTDEQQGGQQGGQTGWLITCGVCGQAGLSSAGEGPEWDHDTLKCARPAIVDLKAKLAEVETASDDLAKALRIIAIITAAGDRTLASLCHDMMATGEEARAALAKHAKGGGA